MCGGKGTRLETAVEKPLYEIAGTPMVEWVISALIESRVETTHTVVSPHAPETNSWVANSPYDVSRIETAGKGYVSDLQSALNEVSKPVLTVAADLPLLDGSAIDTIVDTYEGNSLTVCVPVERKHELGVSIGTTIPESGKESQQCQERAPAGVNIVDSGRDETVYVTDDVRFAVNVNHRRDARVAQELRRQMEGTGYPLNSQHGDQ